MARLSVAGSKGSILYFEQQKCPRVQQGELPGAARPGLTQHFC